MGLLGNYSLLHKSPAHYATGTVGFSDSANWNKSGIVASRFFGEALAEHESMPPGFYAGRAAYPPRIAGRCSTVAAFTISGTASGAEGLPAAASGSITINAAAIGGLIAGGIASGTITISGTATAAGLAASSASGTISINANAIIGATAWGVANGTITVTGAAQAYGLAYGSATTIDTSSLTPQSVAAAVWNSILADYQTAGTAGKSLATASSGGVDYGLLAAAVRTELGVELSEIAEVWQRLALDAAAPVLNSPSSIAFGAIAIALTESGGTVTATRQP